MKTSLLFIVIFACYSSVQSQTAFRKRYYFPDKITYKKSEGVKRKLISSNKEVDDADLLKHVYLSYDSIIQKDKTTTTQQIVTENGVTSKKTISIVESVNDTQKVIAHLNRDYSRPKWYNWKKLRANVKFEKDKLHINPWRLADKIKDHKYYYQLENRQQIKLSYQQVTFTALTIPLRVQFGRDSTINYQTGVSIGALIGHSWGNTKFTYRSNLDNFQRSHELTLGALVNVSAIKFEDDFKREKNTGAIALGAGLLYSYNSISAGISFGWDYALGAQASHWNYNAQPWLGIMIGYSLFKK